MSIQLIHVSDQIEIYMTYSSQFFSGGYYPFTYDVEVWDDNMQVIKTETYTLDLYFVYDYD